ncbi:uncharacterized protein LOC122570272 [Bombus pyrosoma]|uniref:uncharacterized protein LOC122570272 n=1 Tax=Bombus pyrosoma TaxID=396416 RepID=UPI001CB8A168|nr:uncharacterized protein LOC122570272 [Bombus pyrosoma]
MGSDKHTTDKICNLTMLKKNHQFHVVPNNFPLIEDGIIGLPFLTKYRYSVTNNKLTLDEIILPFQKTDSKVGPGETLTSTQYIEGKPTTVCFINTVIFGASAHTGETYSTIDSQNNLLTRLVGPFMLGSSTINTLTKCISCTAYCFQKSANFLTCMVGPTMLLPLRNHTAFCDMAPARYFSVEDLEIFPHILLIASNILKIQ